MDRKSAFSHILLVNAFILVSSFQLPGCRNIDYERCVEIADPLIKEPQLIFPDNMQDIDYVCRKWNNFVDCIRRFTDRCFTENQRRQFNKAVENPIESIHQMCTQPSYQREYLHYAPCMKNTVTERAFCSPHYTLLVSQVSQGDVTSKSVLCCSHHRFRECVLRETRRICDRGIPDGPATRFSTHIMDKAFSFLQEQCINYIPNSGDCAIADNSPSLSQSSATSTPSSAESRWNSEDEQGSSSKSIPTSILTPPKASATPSWVDSSDLSDSDSPSSAFLGSRTRPSTYGRSNGWWNASNANENTQPLDNTVQTFSESPPSVSSPSSWATVSAWNAINPSRGDMAHSSDSQTTLHDPNQSPGSRDDENPLEETDELSTIEVSQSPDNAIRTFEEGSSSGFTPNESSFSRDSSSNEPNSLHGSSSNEPGSLHDGSSNEPDSFHGSSSNEPGSLHDSSSNEPGTVFGQSPANQDSTSRDYEIKGVVSYTHLPGTVSETTYDVSFLTTETTSTTSEETWYPAAGNQFSNEVDEPNQQGWIKPDNDIGSKGIRKEVYVSLTIFAMILTAFR